MILDNCETVKNPLIGLLVRALSKSSRFSGQRVLFKGHPHIRQGTLTDDVHLVDHTVW